MIPTVIHEIAGEPVEQLAMRGFTLTHGDGLSDLVLLGAVGSSGGGEVLFAARVWQEVTGELLDDELVEGQVFIESPDHPIPIWPGPRIQIRLLVFLVRSAAEEALVRKDGQDLAGVGNFLLRMAKPGECQQADYVRDGLQK